MLFFLLQILSILIGILCSYIAWYITYRVIVPKIQFAEYIVKMEPNNENIPRYALRFLNVGKRDIIDIEIKAQVNIMGLFKDIPTVEHQFFMECTFDKFPMLDHDHSNGDSKNSLMFRMMPHLTNEFSREIYSHIIRDKKENKTLSLEDIFNINDNVTIQIIVAGFDAFSGAKKIFISKRYEKKDIIRGHYIENTLDVEPYATFNKG